MKPNLFSLSLPPPTFTPITYIFNKTCAIFQDLFQERTREESGEGLVITFLSPQCQLSPHSQDFQKYSQPKSSSLHFPENCTAVNRKTGLFPNFRIGIETQLKKFGNLRAHTFNVRNEYQEEMLIVDLGECDLYVII